MSRGYHRYKTDAGTELDDAFAKDDIGAVVDELGEDLGMIEVQDWESEMKKELKEGWKEGRKEVRDYSRYDNMI